jgi:hypothetical protein
VPRSYSVALNQSVADRSRIEAIANQSAASWSHASLSSGLKALSAARRHSSALARYSSDLGIGRTLPNAARTRMGPRGPKLPNAVTASLFKRDHHGGSHRATHQVGSRPQPRPNQCACVRGRVRPRRRTSAEQGLRAETRRWRALYDLAAYQRRVRSIPRCQTLGGAARKTASGQHATIGVAAICCLFHHFVGAANQWQWNGNTERLGCLEV